MVGLAGTLFTNQSGVGRGLFSLADVEAVMVGDNTTDWQAGLNAGIRLYDGVAQWAAAAWPARFTAGS